MIYLYTCSDCGELFYKNELAEYLCDWFDCTSEENLEFIGVESK